MNPTLTKEKITGMVQNSQTGEIFEDVFEINTFSLSQINLPFPLFYLLKQIYNISNSEAIGWIKNGFVWLYYEPIDSHTVITDITFEIDSVEQFENIFIIINKPLQDIPAMPISYPTVKLIK